MLTVITKAGRLLIAAVFAVALAFGATQLVASSSGALCQTPPGTCMDDEDCVQACQVYNGTPYGGGCHELDDCCLCLE